MDLDLAWDQKAFEMRRWRRGKDWRDGGGGGARSSGNGMSKQSKCGGDEEYTSMNGSVLS